jgi:hypothetical protein
MSATSAAIVASSPPDGVSPQLTASTYLGTPSAVFSPASVQAGRIVALGTTWQNPACDLRSKAPAGIHSQALRLALGAGWRQDRQCERNSASLPGGHAKSCGLSPTPDRKLVRAGFPVRNVGRRRPRGGQRTTV